ncbi:hypothetical protein [Methanobrevibacter boviskoreani]|jgi:hypothetical protein|uniref:hypothetical protein n=1 Tax=Methanobrevibacter boviskoreani TaxID=1348249 RepID=UPI000592F5CB|nr:hypothetical protein [Methanobrevibacter boviskoreani]
MNNLFILTEERAKVDVIKQILNLYSEEYNKKVKINNLKIIPEIKNNRHTFKYRVHGVEIEEIENITIFIVSGYSSFVDFLLFEQKNKPDNNDDNLLMLIEETKTSDKESRNTGVYQRSSKFVYADYYYPNVPKYMLYNSENKDHDKKPTDTNIFGTNLLLTQNVKILGKDLSNYKKFESIKELVNYKNNMKKPPKGNVPIEITVKKDKIEISGRLSKPAKKGNIGHDPNIGSLTSIAKTLRVLGWKDSIVITKHGVKQEKVDKMNNNKFLKIASILDISLEGITFEKSEIPKHYWKYEENSEKLGTIFLHLLAINLDKNIKGIYENHAGCERGYFYTKSGNILTIPKKDQNGKKLYIPDLILRNDKFKEILLIEGKKSLTLQKGLEEIKHFESIEDEIIKPRYKDYSIKRWIVTYGKDIYHNGLNNNVLLHLNKNGSYYINKNAPSWIKEILHNN